ncbi:MAG TPA: hypothetical protein VHZ52_00040 [Acidobacteriaceae bacterium]|nr:hypothetical protein [Acidobacteriaceae bacterium]
MSRRINSILVAALLVACSCAYGQDPKAEIQRKLNATIVLTKPTADNTDIVKAGSVLDLNKEGLIMYAIDNKVAPTFTYKDGKLSMGFGALMSVDMQLGAGQSGINHVNVPQRRFVAGEKCWAIQSRVQDDGVILELYSDPFDNVRYFSQVKFPFAKKSVPSVDEVMKTIAEVVTPEPMEQDAAPAQAPAQVAPPDPAPAPLAPIAPPPPPADTPPPAPKTVSLGQTKDQVIAILGQPSKVATLGPKEIDYYADMKVIYTKGKVTDVQ